MEARRMENKVNLHEDLIWEILLRLPVKSLVRFKCVSKSWLSLISDVHFAKLHYDLTASHTQQLLLDDMSIADSNKIQIQLVDLEGSLLQDHSVKLFSPFLSSQDVSILGVCRGFILFGHGPKLINLLVWNPSTGVHRALSYSEIGSSLCFLPNIRVNYSFEYDASTDDYFVVIEWIRKYRLDRFELFSMRTNSWKEFDATHLPSTKRRYKCGVLFVNGAIHWLAIDINNYFDGKSVKTIIAFDLTEKNCSKIPLPHDGFVYRCLLKLKIIGGCLCLLYGPRHLGFAELWIMKEYKVKSSWTKCNYIPEYATPLPGCYFSPVYFTKDGLFNGCMALVKLLNDKGELLHTCLQYCKRYHIYTESLLSLPTDSGSNHRKMVKNDI